jgi:tripartite-type tricarboxylate transporter receptor subunit TctC
MNLAIRNLFALAAVPLMSIAVLVPTPPALGQSYPVRPVKIVVGYAPEGPVDVAARIIAPSLQKVLGQPVAIDNRGGASGAVAGAQVAKSPADGYTLFFAASATQTMAPHVQKGMAYDPLKDYTPIALIVNAPNVLVINKGFPAKTVGELVAYAKANPDKVSFGSAGLGASNHLAGELLPEVPSAADLGHPRLIVANWWGIAGPARMPPQTTAMLPQAMAEVLADPAFVKSLKEKGFDPAPLSGDDFARFVQSDLKAWQALAKQANITAEE